VKRLIIEQRADRPWVCSGSVVFRLLGACGFGYLGMVNTAEAYYVLPLREGYFYLLICHDLRGL